MTCFAIDFVVIIKNKSSISFCCNYKMDNESLKIKTRTNYNWDDIVYINDFDSSLLEVIKRESRISANIYYIGYVLYPNYDCNTINPLHFVINRLVGYIEEIEGSND